MRRTGRIHVLPIEEPLRSHVLAHELIHLLRTDAWAVLPPYVEEGLADTAAFEVEPFQSYQLRALRLASALQPWYTVNYWRSRTAHGLTNSIQVTLPRVDIDPVEALLADRATFSIYRKGEATLDPIFRGLGYVVVSRIVERHGFDGFYALCERSVREGHRWLPAEWLLEAADLVNEPELWLQATFEQLGPQERASLLMASQHGDDDGTIVIDGRPGPLDDRLVRRLRSRVAIDHDERELWIERVARRWRGRGRVRTTPGAP
jgi:hypothetical protein